MRTAVTERGGLKRFCKCPDNHCFDQAVTCESLVGDTLDSKGYPRTAKRRLARTDVDGVVIDTDDDTRFKFKKTKDGTRLVPQFNERVDWKTTNGFAAVRLLLSCLGTDGEFVVWDDRVDAPMTEQVWCKRKFGSRSKPSIKHVQCGKTITTTTIENLKSGRGVGCPSCVPKLNEWEHRYDEFVALLPNGFVFI